MQTKEFARFEALLRIDRELYEIGQQLKTIGFRKDAKAMEALRAQIASNLESAQDSAYATMAFRLKAGSKPKPKR